MLHDSPNQTRILARVIWELLKEQHFESLADLADAVKARCAQLKLRVTAEDVNGAFTLISSNTPLVSQAPSPRPTEPRDSPAISRGEASAIWQRLKERHGSPVRIRTIKAAALLGRRGLFATDKQKAWDIVEAEIKAAQARCAALEQAVAKDTTDVPT